jgi:hypothetical protein
MRSRLLAAAFGFLVLLSGCDTADPFGETIILTATVDRTVSGSDIEFAFDSESLTVGRLDDVGCDCALDIGPFLAAQGFEKSDLEAATVESARLVMLFPVSEQLDFLDEAILKLQAPGQSVTEVASRTSFPADRQAELATLSGRNIAGLIDGTTFTPILQLDASQLEVGAEYTVALVLRIRLEVSGE